MDILLFGLATWRISSLLAAEVGPFGVFDKLRRVTGVSYDAGILICPNVLAKGITCVWCNSVWVGAGWAVAAWLWPDARWLALPFALSAITIVIQEAVSWLEHPHRPY
jgi:hypothetical protein